ncbi:Phosphotyrosyl phosphatase activator [Lipomyces tetrasporus]|uniref:Serine/threonine-protein phosphatase 2A activator n=1 Tax=Lipomyces tetrasporus TaxID=54092 RepID=A0AAD7VQS9_9ASCO|nr:Phosphotyrosyl phosphatase activator [Lipomyces tetrasporus]KAJ8098201.1 Phosphotyrosyl phosphatase activator [Lipomyces tetrasporus]
MDFSTPPARSTPPQTDTPGTHHKSQASERIHPPRTVRIVFSPRTHTHLHYKSLEKRIHTTDDLTYFISTTAYARIQFLLSYISSAVSAIPTPKSAEGLSPGVSGILAVFDKLDDLADAIPPVAGPRRFGNPAYKTWFSAVESAVGTLITDMLHTADVSADAKIELHGYLMGALGSFQRLDFRTGHELSFLAFFGGCFFLGALRDTSRSSNSAAQSDETGDITGKEILWIFSRYFKVIRKVVGRYNLEPAGSHGVWGLDDHFHLPYIIGAAQLRGVEDKHDTGKEGNNAPDHPGSMRPPTTKKKESDYTKYGMPRPVAVMNRTVVDDQMDVNMYFGAVAFIYEVKKGPFFEHSPVLYDISGVPYWSKVHTGLLKMYNAEVLGKFPVVQHFGFGGVLFPWTPFCGGR